MTHAGNPLLGFIAYLALSVALIGVCSTLLAKAQMAVRYVRRVGARGGPGNFDWICGCGEGLDAQ